MSNGYGNDPLASAQRVFALALWLVYSLYAALSYPDVLTSVLIGAFFGLVACLAVVFNFKYWRSIVLLASSTYLLLYVIRIVHMTAIAKDSHFYLRSPFITVSRGAWLPAHLKKKVGWVV